MAFITNQWLLGDAIRGRSYSPQKVTIEVSDVNSEWSRAHQVVVDLKLSKQNRDYHSVSLTQYDLVSMLPILISKSATSTKSKIAVDILMQLSDEAFNDLVVQTVSARDQLAASGEL